MNWKRWKLGLGIACLSGGFTGVICWGVGMTGKQALIILAVNVAKDGLLFLQQNPADKISFDTTTITKDKQV